MNEMRAKAEKLRSSAVECSQIRDLATDDAKRSLFERLNKQLSALADDVEQVIADGRSSMTQPAVMMFVCHGCELTYRALQVRLPERGEFCCDHCGRHIHQWDGPYSFTDWTRINPAHDRRSS